MKFKKKILGGRSGLGRGLGCQSGCERRSDAFLKIIFLGGGGGGGASGWGSGWM